MTHTGQGIVSKGSAVTCDYGVYLQSVKGQTLGMTSLGVLCPHARQLYAASFFGGESEHYITSPLASRASSMVQNSLQAIMWSKTVSRLPSIPHRAYCHRGTW